MFSNWLFSAEVLARKDAIGTFARDAYNDESGPRRGSEFATFEDYIQTTYQDSCCYEAKISTLYKVWGVYTASHCHVLHRTESKEGRHLSLDSGCDPTKPHNTWFKQELYLPKNSNHKGSVDAPPKVSINDPSTDEHGNTLRDNPKASVDAPAKVSIKDPSTDEHGNTVRVDSPPPDVVIEDVNDTEEFVLL